MNCIRTIQVVVGDRNTPKTLVEACAEIERLRGKIERLQSAVRTPFASLLPHEQALERLRQINEASYG